MTVNMLSPESKVKILSASERLADPPGAKILLAGASGVGKTSLVRTLNVERTVVLDVAGGLLSIADFPVWTVQIRDWPSLRDIVCRLGGPDPSYLATSPYSPAHFAAVGGPFPGPDDIDTVVLDDIGEAGRIAFRWAAQQPEAVTKSGAKDLLAIYGIVARELIELFQPPAACAQAEHRPDRDS